MRMRIMSTATAATLDAIDATRACIQILQGHRRLPITTFKRISTYDEVFYNCFRLLSRIIASYIGSSTSWAAMATESETAVNVDSAGETLAEMNSPQNVRTNWKTGVIRTLFHVSPDNKMAMKMYGTKKHCLEAQKDQDRTCCMRWMIHPCSNFK